MREHGDALEVDLLRYYNVDLPADLGTARLTWRRLWLLIAHLPRESSYAHAVLGERAQWSTTDHLLATLVDLLRAANYLTLRAHFKGKPEPPKPMRRPGDSTNGDRHGVTTYSIDAMRRMLDSHPVDVTTSERLVI